MRGVTWGGGMPRESPKGLSSPLLVYQSGFCIGSDECMEVAGR